MGLTGLAFVGLATFPGWHEEPDARTGSVVDIKPFPSRPVSQVVLAMLSSATLFLLAAALWQHVAAAAVGTMTSSSFEGKLISHVGSAAVALVWLSLAVIVVVALGMLVMILSIHLLDRLTDE